MIHPQSTPTGPAQAHRPARKPTNAPRLSSAPKLATTYSHPLPSSHANHLSNSHSPPSSISRASTVSSNHSSSLSSDPPIQFLASPISSPKSPYTNLGSPCTQSQQYLQLQYPFPTQATNVTRRRAPPRSPPPSPLHPPALRQVKAVHAFVPEQGNELRFNIGDVLNVLDESSGDGWWEAGYRGG